MVMTYEQIFAVDENNPQNVAANSSILIFDPAVPGVAITITDPTGAPLANPVPTNAKGFGSAFAHATLDRVGWSGGGFTGYFTSYDGMKNVAVAAQAAAEAAGATAAAAASAGVAGVSANADAAAASAAASATAAANSAALVGAPADSAIAAAVNNGASATKAALNATYASKWKANTAYTAGDAVLNPTGDIVTAKVNFTSGASYSAANWNLSSSYLTAAVVTGKLDKTEAASTYGKWDNGKAQLANWHKKLRESPATAKVVFMGDSTSEGSSEAGNIGARLKTVHTLPGEGLDGMAAANIVQIGYSGTRQAGWWGLHGAEVIAAAPDLVVYSLGINDIRLGDTTQAQLTTGITNDVNTLLAALPNADIILRMPNSFLSNDPTTANFVTPLSSAQAYTDILRNTYLDLRGDWPNVVVWNSQDRIFGRTVRTFVQAGNLMKDTLHPSKQIGYPLIADYLVADLIGKERSHAAMPDPVDLWAASRPTHPYTVGDVVRRADSTTSAGTASSGQAYTTDTGTVGVIGERLYFPVATNSRATLDSGIADGEFGVTLTTNDPAQNSQNLVFRFQDASNYLYLRAAGSSGYYQLGRILGGSATVLADVQGYTPAHGDRLRVIAQGTLIRVLVNDHPIWAGTVTDFPAATKIGIQGSSTITRFADLYARRLRTWKPV